MALDYDMLPVTPWPATAEADHALPGLSLEEIDEDGKVIPHEVLAALGQGTLVLEENFPSTNN